MIGEVLNVFRPSRCEKTGLLVKFWQAGSAGPGGHSCNPEGCDILIQNGIRYGWSESNVQYEALSLAARR